MKKIIIIVLALSIILGFLFWKFGPNLVSQTPRQGGPVELTYWGLWEEDSLIRSVIEEYQKQNPNVTIKYERSSSLNYRTRVQTQIQDGLGPDIFKIHNSWLIMFNKDLVPAPADVFSFNEYQTSFYPVAAESFTRDNQIYAVPVGIDGLALYVNVDILNAVGEKIPANWTDFIKSATRMTVMQDGQIQTAGAALGTTSNVDHWQDIIGLLLLQQQGIDLKNPTSQFAADVLKFYTGFIINPQNKTWDYNMPASTQAFAQGRLAYYFAPSWRAHELRQLNPNLNFTTAPVPQLPGRNIAWASFWGEAVSATSKNPKEAWKFIKFLTSKEAERLMYQTASGIRLFGQPYSRMDLAQEVIDDPLVGAYVKQGPYYKFWYLNSNTFDLGINDEVTKYWEDAINATLQGTKSPEDALRTVAQGMNQIFDRYATPSITRQP